ncbi:MAG: O-antigen ligase family protein, partial [Clostridia bacterium]|nr:O-antigen ligase family protein [Clostridia bacterium]
RATSLLTLEVLLLELAWLRKYCRGQRALHGEFSALLILLLAALYALWGLLGAGGKATAYSGLVRCVLLLGYFPTVSLLSHPVWRRRFRDALQMGGFLCGLAGIVEYFFLGAELKWVDTSRFFDLGGRVCATFSNPNVLAVYLLLLIPDGFSLLISEGLSLRRRCFYGAAFSAQALCLVLTFTRGAWLGALGALLLLMLLQSRTTRAWLLLGLPPALLSIPLLPTNILRRFRSIGSMTDSSTRYRLYTWKGVLRMWRAHPWGIGPGEAAFTRIYPSYAVSGTESVMHAHHLLLQTGCELGVVGCLILLILLLWLILQTARGCWRYAGEQRRQLLGAACGLLGVLVMGFFDHIWYHYGAFFLFWQVCACLSAACAEEVGEAFAFGGNYA